MIEYLLYSLMKYVQGLSELFNIEVIIDLIFEIRVSQLFLRLIVNILFDFLCQPNFLLLIPYCLRTLLL